MLSESSTPSQLKGKAKSNEMELDVNESEEEERIDESSLSRGVLDLLPDQDEDEDEDYNDTISLGNTFYLFNH